MLYRAVNQAVLARVPRVAQRILDLGCGTGALGAAIKQRQLAHVTGVTFSEAEAAAARAAFDQVLVADLNTFTASALQSFNLSAAAFDTIIASHVLEHLPDPARLLREILPLLAPGGVLLVALPNVLHWRQRVEFLRGRFRYADGGLMDRTHVRFFDWQAAHELLRGAGCEIIEAVADGAFPGSRFLGPLRAPLDRMALRAFPGLCGFQFVFVCRGERGGESSTSEVPGSR